MTEKNGDLKYKTDNAIDEAYRRGFTDGAMQGGADRHEQREKTLEALMSEYQRGYEDKAKEIRDGEYTFYEKGLNDAWECARKLHKYKNTEIMEIFGLIGLTLGDGCRNEVIQNCSVSEAMQKIKDYEERKTDEIKVGDEVKVYDDCIGIVTRHAPQARTCYVMYRDGSCGEEELTDCKKTGNHSMSLDKWLEQMQKDSEYHADPYHADFALDVKTVIDNFRKESE